MIADRTAKLARDIMEDFKGERVHLLCVLKVPFMTGKKLRNRELTHSLQSFATSSLASAILIHTSSLEPRVMMERPLLERVGICQDRHRIPALLVHVYN